MPARKRTTAHVTDPAMMRVLAHPTRLTLLGLLRERGPQTAAMLGEVVDEAPGTLSYHLGKLASAGLIVEAQEQGSDARERWWRSAHDLTSIEPASLVGDPAALASVTVLEQAISQMWARSYDEYIASLPTLAPAWAAASTAFDHFLKLDVVQAAALKDDLKALADRWQEVSDDNVAAGAEGVESVMLLAQTYRRVRPDEARGARRAPEDEG